MELTGKIENLSIDYKSKKGLISLKINQNSMQNLEELKDIDLDIIIKKFRKKRSLDANSYFWSLCGKLSSVLKIPLNEIYRTYVKNIGDNFQIVPIKSEAVNEWIAIWESRGTGWICEVLDDSKLNGYVKLICYYGSSTYNTKQMSCLIDLIVFDCNEQNIETKTENEIEKMKGLWKNEQSKK